jgi:hypothetical protein
MRNLTLLALMMLQIVAAMPVLAQDDTASGPGAQTDVAPPVAAVAGDQSNNPEQLSPDTNPLSGARLFTLGNSADRASSIGMSFNFGQMLDTNVRLSGGTQQNQATANASGSLNLQLLHRRSSTALSYTGGAWLGLTGNSPNSTFQQLHLTQTFDFRRWSLLVADQTLYTPQTFFQFLGTGLTPGTLNSSLVPNQSILFGSSLLSNTVAGQASYQLSDQSSLTALGSFGTQDLLNNGIDSRQELFQFGYDRALSESDSVALTYGLLLFQYPGQSSTFTTHQPQLRYGRKITGRMALQASVGPQIVTSSGSPWVNWSVQVATTYQFPQTLVTLSYNHGINSGAGYFIGANGHAVLANLTRPLTQRIQGTANFAYARNSALLQVLQTQQPQPSPVPLNQAFNTEFAGLGLQWLLTRSTSLNLTYNLQHQSSNLPLCGTTCSDTLLRHMVMIGVQWQLGPYGLGR